MENQPKKKKRLVQFWFYLYDGVWSVPAALFIFWCVGYLLQYFDVAAGTYDIGFVQPMFLAAGIVIFAANVAVAGIYSLHRGFFRFYYGRRTEDGVENEAKSLWKNLTAIQKFGLALLWPLVYFLATILVYLKMI